MSKLATAYGRTEMIKDLIQVVDNMHAGKDDWVEQTDRLPEDEIDEGPDTTPPIVDLVL